MRKNRMQEVVGYVVLGLIAALFIIPLLWLLLASFDANATQVLQLPEEPVLDN